VPKSVPKSVPRKPEAGAEVGAWEAGAPTSMSSYRPTDQPISLVSHSRVHWSFNPFGLNGEVPTLLGRSNSVGRSWAEFVPPILCPCPPGFLEFAGGSP
jgi:hypothetical protein